MEEEGPVLRVTGRFSFKAGAADRVEHSAFRLRTAVECKIRRGDVDEEIPGFAGFRSAVGRVCSG